jgi:hypothetical protein
MTFHLIFLKNELHIVPVRPEQEMAFFQQHGQRILASGESVPEVLRIFNELPVISTTAAERCRLLPEVQLQTAFQHDDATAEADRSAAEAFEMSTDRQILPLDPVDAVRAAPM